MDEKRQVQEALDWLCDAISPATLRKIVVLPTKEIVESYAPSCYLPASKEDTMEEVTRFIQHYYKQRYCKACPEWDHWLAQQDAIKLVYQTFSSGPLHRLHEWGAHRIAADEGIPALIDVLVREMLEADFRRYVEYHVLWPIRELPVSCRYGVAEAFQRSLPKPPGVSFEHPMIFEIHFEDAIWHQARLALTLGGPAR